MKQSTKRLLSSIAALLLLVGAFIVFADLIKPAFDAAIEVKGEELARRSFVENQLAVIRQVTNLISAYEEQQKLQDLVSLSLPLTPSVAEALAQLSGLAQSNGLSPQSFVVSAPTIQNVPGKGRSTSLIKPVGLITFRFRLVGTYEDFKRFLRNAETNIRILDVESITIQPVGKSTQNLYSYDLTVDAYYQNP